MTILTIIFLFLAAFFTLLNIYRLYTKNGLTFLHILLQTIGLVGFITIKYLL